MIMLGQNIQVRWRLCVDVIYSACFIVETHAENRGLSEAQGWATTRIGTQHKDDLPATPSRIPEHSRLGVLENIKQRRRWYAIDTLLAR